MKNKPANPTRQSRTPDQPLHPRPGATDMNATQFKEANEQIAQDCESFANMLKELAASVRAGDRGAFERFFIEGGTEEGDAKIQALRERIVLRYCHRTEVKP